VHRRAVIAFMSIGIVAGCNAAAPTPSPQDPRTSVESGAPASAAPTALASRTPTGGPPAAAQPVDISSATLPSAGYRLAGIATAEDGGVWIVSPDDSVTGGGSVVALLGPDLQPRPGWPLRIIGWICGSNSNSGGWAPQPTTRGSVRVVCRIAEGGQGDPLLGLELDAAGKVIATWHSPVGYWWDYQPQFVGDRLVALGRDVPDFEGVDAPTSPSPQITYWITSTGSDGSVTVGSHVSVPMDTPVGVALGSNGTSYVYGTSGISAFDLAGSLAGWPVSMAPDRSLPGISSHESIVVTQSLPDSGHTTVLRVMDGQATALSSSLAMSPVVAFDGQGQALGIAPLLRDGIATVIGRAANGLVIRRFGDSEQHDGWPLDVPGSLDTQGSCAGSTVGGCGVWTSLPSLLPDGTLLVPIAARSATAGPQILAVGADAKPRVGWPIVAGGPGTHVWSLIGDGRGGVYALVSDALTGSGSKTEIVSIAQDGTVRARLTLEIAPA
jgi:hypothetical protein